ncbi:MAG: redoxin domain-containing protein [Candidatus Baltobacteraceae bacterium]
MKLFVWLALALLTGLVAPAAAQTRAPLSTVLGAENWLNGRPNAQTFKGKVVVLDVFTFDCINCKHVVPELRSLYRNTKRDDLSIIGIHSPETSYEKQHGNVVANLALQGIVWPVAIDNDFSLWRAYGVDAWPTQLIFDRHGVLRKTVVGDSQDDVIAAEVRQLLSER